VQKPELEANGERVLVLIEAPHVCLQTKNNDDTIPYNKSENGKKNYWISFSRFPMVLSGRFVAR
jgi:hypothetical protein